MPMVRLIRCLLIAPLLVLSTGLPVLAEPSFTPTGRVVLRADAASPEQTPRDWIAFLAEVGGSLRQGDELTSETPRLLLLKDGTLIWREERSPAVGAARDPNAWRLATLSPERLASVQEAIRATGLFTVRGAATPSGRPGPRRVIVGAQLDGKLRMVESTVGQSSGAQAPPLLRAASAVQSALLGLRTVPSTRFRPDVIRVGFFDGGAVGKAGIWPLERPPVDSSRGYQYFQGREAEAVIELLARYDRVQAGPARFLADWAPAIRIPTMSDGVSEAAAGWRAEEPGSIQIRWDSGGARPLPALWLVSKRPAPVVPGRAFAVVGPLPPAMCTQLHAWVVAAMADEARDRSIAQDGYTFAFEQGPRPIAGGRLSRLGSAGVMEKLIAVLERSPKPDAALLGTLREAVRLLRSR